MNEQSSWRDLNRAISDKRRRAISLHESNHAEAETAGNSSEAVNIPETFRKDSMKFPAELIPILNQAETLR